VSALYLFARIAGTAVAIRTEEIEAVVRLKDVSPVPGVPSHVVGLSALRSRVLTVVDAATLIMGPAAVPQPWPDGGRLAVMCDVGGHSYGVLVDSVEDIAAIPTPPLPLCGRVDRVWEPHARAVVENEGRSHFVLSIASLLDQGLPAQVA